MSSSSSGALGSSGRVASRTRYELAGDRQPRRPGPERRPPAAIQGGAQVRSRAESGRAGHGDADQRPCNSARRECHPGRVAGWRYRGRRAAKGPVGRGWGDRPDRESELLAAAAPFALPMRRTFRGVRLREARSSRASRMGSSLPSTTTTTCLPRAGSARPWRRPTGTWPAPRRMAIAVNAIIPAVDADAAAVLVRDAVLRARLLHHQGQGRRQPRRGRGSGGQRPPRPAGRRPGPWVRARSPGCQWRLAGRGCGGRTAPAGPLRDASTSSSRARQRRKSARLLRGWPSDHAN
jgi:hypothetical protein